MLNAKALDALFGDRLAPDGSLVRENFAKWFGQSKAVDNNGTPLRLFHGTACDFDAFQNADHGLFFTQQPDAASAYALGTEEGDDARVLPVYLRLENPLVTDQAWLKNFEIDHLALIHAAAIASKGTKGSFVEDFEDSENWARQLVIKEALRLGHDGLILPQDLLPVEHLEGDWDLQTSYVVFDASQVKSALGNSGLYHTKNCCLIDQPDLRQLRAVAARSWLADAMAPAYAKAPTC